MSITPTEVMQGLTGLGIIVAAAWAIVMGLGLVALASEWMVKAVF